MNNSLAGSLKTATGIRFTALARRFAYQNET